MEERPCRRGPAHLAVVAPLLNELVHYFLCLLVTLLLQVCDERVQVAGAVVRLHDGLVRLDDAGDTCGHRAAPCGGNPEEDGAERSAGVGPLTFQQQRQSVCKHERRSLLSQISSRRQTQVLLGFGGNLWREERETGAVQRRRTVTLGLEQQQSRATSVSGE